MSTDPILLLNPEWQGYGESPDVYFGAMTLAAALLPAGRVVTTVDVPEREQLERADGVLGLASIAPRFVRTIAMLRDAAPDRIFSIGGTCGTDLAPVGYLNERHEGRIAVLWLDAHADLNTPATSPTGHFHGMVLRTLLGEGPTALTAELARPLEAAQVFLLGTRDFDPPESDFVARTGIAHVGIEAFRRPEMVIDQLRAARFRQVYIHLDLDVINPTSFAGALFAVPGGPALAQVESLLAAIAAACDIVGVSVVEYRGERDGVGLLCSMLRRTGLFSTEPGQAGRVSARLVDGPSASTA